MSKPQQTVWVDFQLIKERVTLHQVTEYYGITLTQKANNELVGVCPLHGTPEEPADNPTAFRISADGRAWKCFTRCQEPKHGNVLEFIIRKEGCDLRQAGVLLTQWFLLDSAQIPHQEKTKEKPAQPSLPKEQPTNDPLNFTLKLKKDIPFLLETKELTLNTIEKFGLGYCAKGMHAGRVVIPIHNSDGTLVAYAGRTLKQTEVAQGRKYHFPAQFHKQVILFNLHRVLHIPKLINKRGIILVEGFFDAISLWQQGIYNAVAIMGTSLSEWQEQLLLTYTDKVTVFLDNNPAGKQGTEKIVKQLYGKCFVKIPIYPPDKEQPEQLSKAELAAILGYGDGSEHDTKQHSLSQD